MELVGGGVPLNEIIIRNIIRNFFVEYDTCLIGPCTCHITNGIATNSFEQQSSYPPPPRTRVGMLKF